MKRSQTGYVSLANGELLGTEAGSVSTSKATLVNNIYGSRAYLVIVTSAETGGGAASLDVTVTTTMGTSRTLVTGLGAAITTNTTTFYLLGRNNVEVVASPVVAATGDHNPLPPKFTVTITVGGTLSSFVVHALLAFC
jgi:hypothetical protein